MIDGFERATAVLWAPFGDPESRTFWPALLLTVAVAWLATRSLPEALGLRHWSKRSALLDLQILAARRLLSLLLPVASSALAFGMGLFLTRQLDTWLGVPSLPRLPLALLSALYTATLFVAWDASRWLLHRAMHDIPMLWQLHQVHHSASVLTPLTFHRVHPIESLLQQIRGAIVGGILAGLAFWLWRGAMTEITVLGINALGLLLNLATGNLRHSHIWLRFPPSVERWLLSPAQHQLHHALDSRWQRCNYGTWLSIWDRLSGSFVPSPTRPPEAYGLRDIERNHRDDLLSVLFDPLFAICRLMLGSLSRSLPAGLVFLLLSPRSQAEEPAETTTDAPPEDPEDPAYELIVVGPRGLPRVGGSAHEVTEEELTRWGYDDIHRVLTKVPGVYVRGEDGFGLRPNIGMRGGSSDRSAKIALTQDGLPLSPAPYAAPAAYYFPLASRLVGIEVFKGAASIRHGPQTIGGAVNVLTRDIPSEHTEGTLDLTVGLRSTAEAHSFVGSSNDRYGLLVEAAHLSTRGFKQLDGGGPTGFSRQDLLTKLRFGGSRSYLQLALGYGRESSSESYLGLSAGDFEQTPYRRYAASALDHMRWDHTESALSWNFAPNPRFSFTSTAYHHWLARSWTKLNRFSGGPDLHDLLLLGSGGQSDVYLAILRGEEDTATPDQELMIGTNDRTFHNGGIHNVAVLRNEGKHVGSTLEIGVRLHFDDAVRLHTEDPYAMTDGRPVPTGGETLTTLDSHTTARALALYAAEDARIGPLHLLPGVRTELIRTASGTRATGAVNPIDQQIVLPGMGVYAELAPWIDALAGLHRGFSPVPPGSSPETRPESAWSSEGGLRLHGAQSHAEIIGFFSDYDNLTGQCTLSGGCADDQLDQQFNGGRAHIAGVETMADHLVLLPHRISIGATASWTYTRAVFRTGFVSEFPQWGTVAAGDALPYVPAHQGNASLLLDWNHRVGFSVSATGRSAMRDEAGADRLADSTDPGVIPGMVQLDSTLQIWPTDRVRVHTSVTNLTNAVILESQRPFGARPASPLQLSLGVSVGQPRVAR